MIELQVNLGRRSYPVRIGPWRDWELRTLFEGTQLGRWAIVADGGVWELWGRDLLSGLGSAGVEASVLCLEAGERSKSHETVFRVYDHLLAEKVRRDGVLAVFGGGVLGDVAGFAAATYQRGIRYVQIPTTLLSMVDSSVGGKTGVNYGSHKNMVGAFHQPSAVLISPEWLISLPEREFRSGLAEVIKCGIIQDVRLIEALEDVEPARLVRSERLEEVIARGLGVKARIVEQDETDLGIRKHLNFGHTVGHAIEALTGFERFLHGEAVAIGILAALRVPGRWSVSPGSSGSDRRRCSTGSVSRPELTGITVEQIIGALEMDKKASNRGQVWC
ncbi:MAG: 3-dehydroquinate synthase [Candidatus Eisenbacteria bacterium]